MHRSALVEHGRRVQQDSPAGRKEEVDGGLAAAKAPPRDWQPPAAGPRKEAGRCRAGSNTVEVGGGSLACRSEPQPARPDRDVATAASGSHGEMWFAGGAGFDWRRKARIRSDLPPSARPSRGQPESIGRRRMAAEERGEPVERAGQEERECRSERPPPVARSGHRGCWDRAGRPERAIRRPIQARTRETGAARGMAPRSPIPSRLDGPARWTEPG